MVDDGTRAMRPQQVGRNTDDIREAVSQASELDDTVKLYAKMFVHKFTGDMHECYDHFTAKYGGRVLDDDWKIEKPFPLARYCWLHLRLWNLMGEFKHRADAEEWASLNLPGEMTRIVGRSTRAEVELRDYGKKKLNLRASTSAPT